MSLTPRLDQIDKNYLINGALDFWQRGTSFAANAVSGGLYYLADRFGLQYATPGSSFNFQIDRVNDSPDVTTTPYSIKITPTLAKTTLDAGDYAKFFQRIEGYLLRELYNQNFEASFWVKTNKAGTYGVYLRDSSYTTYFVTEFTIKSSDLNNWKEIRVDMTHQPVGTFNLDNQRGMEFGIALVTGLNYQTSTLNSWATGDIYSSTTQVNFVDSTTNYIQFTKLMLSKTKGASFSRAARTIPEELTLCQRYYEKSYKIDVAPGTITNEGRVSSRYYIGTTTSLDPTHFNQGFIVTKRIRPTMVIYSPSTGASGVCDVENNQSSCNVIDASEVRFIINLVNAISAGTSYLYSAHYTADAEL